ADPTVQYGIGLRGGSWWPQITVEDYQTARSPYNTYLNTGLPPGPIASPGLAAIRAALNPEASSYLYFRARCDGSGYHDFAVTFEEHLANGC
ncbi:MAG: endolytic transglycosylase MltG, partial [Anaerolineae bacterium]|nr:endolytic transglycosylase MltG [Anaerolineae bacterium]